MSLNVLKMNLSLSVGEVIKGWDDGIATMKMGERSIFIVPPELGYAEIGSPPLIPPNSTLVFEVEMVSWHTIKDISGDGGILKKIIVEGEGWATPRETDEVLGIYSLHFSIVYLFVILLIKN